MNRFAALAILSFSPIAAVAQAPSVAPLSLRAPMLPLPRPAPLACTLPFLASPIRCLLLPAPRPVPVLPERLQLQVWLGVPPALR